MSNPNMPAPNPEQSEQQESLLRRTVEEAQITYHGIRQVISHFRIERASKTAELMDHKDALYEHAGNLSLRGTSNTTERGVDEDGNPADVTPTSRSFIERLKRNQIEKRGFKAAMKRQEQERVRKIYGGTHNKSKGAVYSARKLRTSLALGRQDMPFTERTAEQYQIGSGNGSRVQRSRNYEQTHSMVDAFAHKKMAEISATEPVNKRIRSNRRNRADKRAESSAEAMNSRRDKIQEIRRRQAARRTAS